MSATQKRPMCRFEEFDLTNDRNEKIHVILDVCHNQPGFEAMYATMQKIYPDVNLRVFSFIIDNDDQMICGFCADKNISDCVKIILQHTNPDHMRLINSSHPRSLKAESLRKTVKELCMTMGKNWSDGMIISNY